METCWKDLITYVTFGLHEKKVNLYRLAEVQWGKSQQCTCRSQQRKLLYQTSLPWQDQPGHWADLQMEGWKSEVFVCGNLLFRTQYTGGPWYLQGQQAWADRRNPQQLKIQLGRAGDCKAGPPEPEYEPGFQSTRTQTGSGRGPSPAWTRPAKGRSTPAHWQTWCRNHEQGYDEKTERNVWKEHRITCACDYLPDVE